MIDSRNFLLLSVIFLANISADTVMNVARCEQEDFKYLWPVGVIWEGRGEGRVDEARTFFDDRIASRGSCQGTCLSNAPFQQQYSEYVRHQGEAILRMKMLRSPAWLNTL